MPRILLLLLSALLVVAQTRQIRPASAEKRLALVIGNDAYPDKRLNNAVNDARAMQSALTAGGFEVRLLTDARLPQLEEGIEQFIGGVRPGDTALFYYSGHGMQIQDQNYLVPVDFAAKSAIEAKYKAFPVQRVLESLEGAGAALQIVILDACRDNPYRSVRGASGGLAQMQAGRGVYIAFATAPGKTASDNPGQRNGLFTGELLQVLRQPGLSLDDVFNETRLRVSRLSANDQIPWSNSSLLGKFYFVSGNAPSAPEAVAETWAMIKDSRDPADFENFAKAFPGSEWSKAAQVRAAQLRRGGIAAAPHIDPAKTPHAGDVKTNAKDGQKYVWIPPGTFMMGCSPGGSYCSGDETPAHEVTITKGFWMGQTSVTQAAYERVIGKNPSYYKGAARPVVHVNWNEATTYCHAIGGRLPTEAEWEWAARGGTDGPLYGHRDDIAWYQANSGSKSHEVRQKQPNAYGLYDVLGNVSQWTADWYSEKYYTENEKRDPHGPPTGEYRVVRGSSWDGDSGSVRVSIRLTRLPVYFSEGLGLRCVGE